MIVTAGSTKKKKVSKRISHNTGITFQNTVLFIVNKSENLEGVIPLCGKIIYLLYIYNILPSTQYYGIFT